MKVVTAIESYIPNENDICVFLAGGITNCPNWQNEVIKELRKFKDTDSLVVLNPRRENFPIHSPNASQEQIAWEFKWLERMDIFSMYFSGGESVQPICMYELGRNILRIQNRFPKDWQQRIVISVEDGYRRKQDVVIQTSLATDLSMSIVKFGNYELATKNHAVCIIDAYTTLKDLKLW